MAVIKFRRIGGGRAGSFNDKRVSEYTDAWFVQTNSAHDGVNTILTHGDCPRVGVTSYNDPANQLESNPYAICKKVQASQQGRASKVWLVVANYSTEIADPAKQSDSPLTKPPDRKFGFVKVKKAATYDALGQHVVNSALQPFDPPIEYDLNHLTYTVVFNVAPAAYSPSIQAAYMDSVNTDLFMGFLPWQCAVREFSADEQYEQGVGYFRVTVQIEFAVETHWTVVLDQGYYELIAGKWVEIVSDGRKEKVTTPFPLNGAGRRINAVKPPGPAPRKPFSFNGVGTFDSSGGLLAEGTYLAAYAYVYGTGVDAVDGPLSPVSGPCEVRAGDILQLDFDQDWLLFDEALPPAGVTVCSIYLTEPNGAAHTLRRYATGVAVPVANYLAAIAHPMGQLPPVYSTPHYKYFMFLRPQTFAFLNLP